MGFFHLGLFFILLLLQPSLLPAGRHMIADCDQEKDFRSERVPNHHNDEIAAVNRRGGGGGGGHGGGGGGHGVGGGHGGGYGEGRGSGRRPNPAVVIPVIVAGSSNRHHRHGPTGNSGTLNSASTLGYFALTVSVSLLLSQV